MVNLQSPPPIEVGKVSLSDFHAKLYANELLRRYPSDNIERFTVALLDSKVDLNPHQIDAALFAFRSPLSKGAILADEVGLGKLTFPVKCLWQAASLHRGRVILTNPATELGYQWEFYDDARDSHPDKQQPPLPKQRLKSWAV
jgi:hypothetical protein